MIDVIFKGHQSFGKSLAGLNSQIEKKVQQALNRTFQRSRTQMTNAVGEKLNIRKKTIRELMSIQRATKITGLIGKLILRNKPVPLIEYNAKPNRKGVSFKVFKDRTRQLIKHAFITSDVRKRETVFKREGAARLKIKPLYGTRVTDVAGDRLHNVGQIASRFFNNEVQRVFGI